MKGTHIHREACWYIFTITDVFLNQKRVNVCTSVIVKMLGFYVFMCLSSGDLFIFSLRVSSFFSYFCYRCFSIFPFHMVSLLMYEYKRKTWKGEVIKKILKTREECDICLTHVCRHRWRGEKIEYIELSYSWWKPQCWLKAPYIWSYHWALSATVMSTDVSQVGVALFPSF